jgi:hypothetical protein
MEFAVKLEQDTDQNCSLIDPFIPYDMSKLALCCLQSWSSSSRFPPG